MAFIEVDHVSHIYHTEKKGEHRAIDDVSLSINRGEFIAILGTNGSGKSTLARHFNGLLLPTEGRVSVDGIDTADTETIWKLRGKVGMVFQNPDNQIIAALVEDDVAFGPENLGVPPEEIRVRVHDALESVDMLRYRHFAPHLLSGGQKQRIAIAGALAMKTRCVVFDEPTAMLDPQGREEVLRTIETLHREQGLTVILITHFMEEAVSADRVFVIEQGKLLMEGTPREIFREMETMQRLGLDVPAPARIAARLRKHGISLPPDILTREELADAVSAALRKDHVH